MTSQQDKQTTPAPGETAKAPERPRKVLVLFRPEMTDEELQAAIDHGWALAHPEDVAKP